MEKILSSASKLVFIMLAAGATVGLFTDHISQDNFMILAVGAFAFYFSHKGDSSKPYLGK